MPYYLNKVVDVVEEIANATFRSNNFNPHEWCMDDVETLLHAAAFVKQRIEESHDQDNPSK